MNQWITTDEGFREELVRGRGAEMRVAFDLLDAGFEVQTGRCEFRETFEDRHDFADEPDVLVGRGHVIEVKSRSLSFTAPADYPYDTAFVCATRRWDARTHKPCAVVLVSEPTGSRVVIPTSTRRAWTVEKFYDGKRGFDEQAFAAPRSCLRTWETLLDHLTYSCGRFGEL